MGGAYKMLELLEHPGESLGSYANIIIIETGLLVNNGWFAVSYLNNVDVGKSSGLSENVSHESPQRDGAGPRIPHPHESEILHPTYPRKGRDPRRVRHSRR